MIMCISAKKKYQAQVELDNLHKEWELKEESLWTYGPNDTLIETCQSIYINAAKKKLADQLVNIIEVSGCNLIEIIERESE